MAKRLTVAAIEKYRGGTRRREIADSQCGGLHLVIQPKTGAKSWALRFRQNGRPVKLTLGPWSEEDVDGDPIIGQPLSLTAARVLGAKINRQRAAGHDPIADRKADKLRRRIAKTAAEANVFPQAAHEYIWTQPPELGRRCPSADWPVLRWVLA